MKILRYVCTKLVIVAIAWSFAAAASIQARQPRSSSGSAGSDNAYLIVNRAANFGTRESINLSVDGVQVAVIGLNGSYEGVLRPGKHVLSMTTNPDGSRNDRNRVASSPPGVWSFRSSTSRATPSEQRAQGCSGENTSRELGGAYSYNGILTTYNTLC